jgi:hypothetical protein
MPGQPTAGREDCPEEILCALPRGWKLDGASALDFDAALAQSPHPPLAHRDGSFGLICSVSAFTRMDRGWAAWLLELRRLLADDGLLVIGLSAPAEFERLSGTAWEDSRLGMTVLAALGGTRDTVIFHSEWWLRAHWGRAFQIRDIERGEPRRVVMRKSLGRLLPDDLERPESGDERELAAAFTNAALLRSQLDLMRERHRGQIEELREEMGRELMRRSFAAADLEWARGGPGSPAALVAAEYEATTSWKLTRPLRALGARLRRAR